MSNFKKIFNSPPNQNFFFGYYDKLQLNSTNRYLLALKVDFINRLPLKDDIATIGYFDIKTKKFHKVASTNTFNWQQGAMLQWLGPKFDKKIIFNKFYKKKYISVIRDITTGSEKKLKAAIYDVDSKGKYALCIDFSRHYWCRRGYSYDALRDPNKNNPVVEGDGIFLLNIAKNTLEKIIDIKDLIKFKPILSMNNATHYLEHCMFAPDGNLFAYYHRWKLQNGSIYTRLYISNLDNSYHKLVHDTGRLSHMCWLDQNRILAFGSSTLSLAGYLRRFTFLSNVADKLMPFYKRIIKGNSISGQSSFSKIINGDCYFIIDINQKNIFEVFENKLNSDGHPSLLNLNHNLIVTDSYPDTQGLTNLYLCDFKNNDVHLIDQLKSISKYDNSALRCDLHPKVSLNGKFISIDTMNDGYRSIYLYTNEDLENA